MKNILFILFFLPSLVIAQKGVGEMVSRECTDKDLIVCPHSNHYVPNYSPRKSPSKKLKSNAAQFVPIYNDVPPEFQEAIEFIFDVTGDLISSDVPINVSIDYVSIGGNTLAQAGPTSIRANFPGAHFADTAYPIALAEKLAGRELNGAGNPDIFVEINSNIDWNTTPDNPDIGNMFDLATIFMHELFHGLGFVAPGRITDDNLGVLSEWVFSRFIENQQEVNVLENIENGSAAMRNQLTGDRLFFRNTEREVRERYKLYAPANFAEGSSISHLDRTVFQGTEHRLMTPFSDRGDVNYEAGFSQEIFDLMGWNSSSIVHDPGVFTEDVSEDYLLTATVNSDNGIDTSSLFLHYSRDSFNREDIVIPLDFDARENEFSFLFEAPFAESQVQYYFEFSENSGLERSVPSRADDYFFTYNWGSDQIAPVIDGHVPIETIRETDTEITFNVNDLNDVFTGIDTSSLALEIMLNGELETIPFEIVEGEFGDFFEARFSRPDGFELTDELSYRIIVFDVGVDRNQGSLPVDGFFDIEIQEVSASVVTYINDFDVETNDFTGSGFRIAAPPGFSDASIHSDHPYRNAGEGNTLNFTYELNQLIQIDDRNPIIRFDEVVIVEPGQPGTSCNRAVCPLEFWDYVVVEGNKLGTSTWLALTDAYDSRDNSDFRAAYDAERNGTSALFRPKEISLIENGSFEVGDEIFIRFRLFSDPFAVGWGWAIDNLEIQPETTSILETEYVDQFEIYPNPATTDQVLTIEINLREELSGQLSLVNITGQKLLQNTITNTQNVNVNWDLSSLTPGIYFAQLQNELGTSVRKIVVE